MAHTMNDAAHSAFEDRSCEVGDLRHMLYILSDALATHLNEDRGRVDGEIVTLKFGRDNLDALIYLASEAWKRSGEIQDKMNALLNDSVSETPPMAQAA